MGQVGQSCSKARHAPDTPEIRCVAYPTPPVLLFSPTGAIYDYLKPGLILSKIDWDQANCRGLEVSTFFLERGKRSTNATKICSACSIKSECLQYACYYKEKGIWGGTTDDEREMLKRWIVVDIDLVSGENHDIESYIEKVRRGGVEPLLDDTDSYAILENFPLIENAL